MTEIEMHEANEPSPRAVKFGRFVFCLVGAVLLGIPMVFSYFDPSSKVLLASLCMGTGLLLIWLGLALPSRVVAHFGFWLSWFLPNE